MLNDHDLDTRYDCWLALEKTHASSQIELRAEQTTVFKNARPYFRQRRVESTPSGELLSADPFCAGTPKGIGKVYLHVVVTTYGSHAFGCLHVSKQPEAAVAVLHNDVWPCYHRLE